MSNPERVVITGMGAVTPVGLSAVETYRALIAGRSGVRRMDWSLGPDLEVCIGGAVEDFVPQTRTLPGGQPIGRLGEFAITAAREAVADAGLLDAGYDSDSIATIFGLGIAGIEALEEACRTFRCKQSFDTLPPLLFERICPAMPLELVAQEAGATGPNWCTVSACASSVHAIGQAFELIQAGGAAAVVTGGSDAALTPFVTSLFERVGALSMYGGDPERASRPFDADRGGFVLGEGAGILVLESLANASRRGARIYAEVIGYGASADAFHVTKPAPDGEGMALAMATALRVAKIDLERVDYVNAHGTGTHFNDLSETLAIKRVFGDHAKKLAVSSNKSMTGHLVGAAAAVELIATAHTLAGGIIPPTLNLERPDPECDLDYVPQRAREQKVRVAMKNSFGFGGQNGSLILKSL